MVEPLDGRPDVYAVDTELLGSPGLMAAYVVDAERPAVVDPGAATAVAPLLDALDELGIAPESVAYLIPTHVHPTTPARPARSPTPVRTRPCWSTRRARRI